MTENNFSESDTSSTVAALISYFPNIQKNDIKYSFQDVRFIELFITSKIKKISINAVDHIFAFLTYHKRDNFNKFDN